MAFKKLSRFMVMSIFLALLAFPFFNTSVNSANTGELISASDLSQDAKLASVGNRVLMIELIRRAA